MRLVAIVQSADHVCCRYRLAAFRDALARAGHSLDFVSLPKSWWSRLLLFRRLRGCSVVLQRFLLPGWQLALLRRSVRHLIFDFDDAVFLRDSYSPKGLHHAGRLRRFAYTVRAADVVIAGNDFLAENAARFCDSARVRVVPTCVDAGKYTPRHEPGDGNKLVWIGSSSTLQGVEVIAPLLDHLAATIPQVRLKIVCDRFPAFARMPVITCPWNSAREAVDLANADIGISWIPDDLWSRGKCGLKVLQYMATGLPVVCNPVGVHSEIVRHGETGFLAETPDQWRESVARLVADAELRARMGRAGRERFEAYYATDAGADAWLALLRSMQAARQAC